MIKRVRYFFILFIIRIFIHTISVHINMVLILSLLMMENISIPPIVRESKPIVYSQSGTASIVQSLSPSDITVLSCTNTKIKYMKTLKDPYKWQYSGTDGIFINSETVYIISLSSRGLVEKIINIEAPRKTNVLHYPSQRAKF